MKILKYSVLLISLLAITGCASTVEEIQVTTKPTQKPKLVVPQADELNLRKVEWYVLTTENFEQKIKEIETQGENLVFFALTSTGYEDLSLNLNDLRTHVEQKNRIIVAYENYYSQ